VRRALGRGLSQMIGEPSDSGLTELLIGDIAPNARQPRLDFDDDALRELADSIGEVGVLQPVLVRPTAGGKYELIAGERRLRASKLAGLTHIPAVVRTASQQASLELALIENVQREDISSLECAQAFQRLSAEFGLTQEQIARRVGKTRAAIANTMRLLRLPKEVQEALRSGTITEGHARAIQSAATAAEQVALFRTVVAKGLSVRDTERLTQSSSRGTRAAKRPADRDPDWAEIESALSVFLGSPVELQRQAPGGRLVVRFFSDDDLQRVLDTLGFRL